MAFIRITDNCWDDIRIVQAGPAAAWMWAMAIAYAQRHSLDGFIPEGCLRVVSCERFPRRVANRLVSAGLFERVEGGYRIVYDEALCETPAKRLERIDRVARHYYPRDIRDAVRERDGDDCRYCWRKVLWGGRDVNGGTFDHIDPMGPATLENLVVACRSCNSRKGQRTPAQAGMELLEPLEVR